MTSRGGGADVQVRWVVVTIVICSLTLALATGTEFTLARSWSSILHADEVDRGSGNANKDYVTGRRWMLASHYPQRSPSSSRTTGEKASESDLRSFLGATSPRENFSWRPAPSPSANHRAPSSPVALASSAAADRRRARAGKHLPDTIIVGVKKGGTRALLEYLKLHPDVRAAGREVHFFDRHYRKGLDWYSELFDVVNVRSQMPATLPGQLTVEKTPSYLVTPDVAERVHNMSRDHIRVLVVVRDPVTRALSDYAQSASKRPHVADFESLAFAAAAAAAEGSGNRSIVDAAWSPIRLGLYARYVGPWLRRFGPDRVLFVHGERLVTDPAAEMGIVQRFLGLRPVVDRRNFYFNATKGFPCLRVTAGAPPDGGSRTRCLGSSKGRRHPVIDPDSLHRLRQFYRPFNTIFYQMTGIDFGWN